MKLNETPIRTCVNYGINDYEIQDTELKHKLDKHVQIKLENFDDCALQKANRTPTHPLNENLKSELKQANSNIKINIEKNNSKSRVVSINIDDGLIQNLIFEVEKNVQSNLLIKISGNKNCYHNGFIKFVCNQASLADIIVINELDEGSKSLLQIETEVKENANCNLTFVDFTQKYSIINVYAKLEGEKAKNSIKNIYVAGKTSKTDINIFQDIYAKNCIAETETVGVLQGVSEKNFKATIKFNRGSAKSVGSENELCLNLSPNAKSKALPILLCEEEDVEGNHSTAIGKVSEKELFYLMSRGLTKTDALKLEIKAKLQKVLSEIEIKLKEEILKKIDGEIYEL